METGSMYLLLKVVMHEVHKATNHENTIREINKNNFLLD